MQRDRTGHASRRQGRQVVPHWDLVPSLSCEVRLSCEPSRDACATAPSAVTRVDEGG